MLKNILVKAALVLTSVRLGVWLYDESVKHFGNSSPKCECDVEIINNHFHFYNYTNKSMLDISMRNKFLTSKSMTNKPVSSIPPDLIKQIQSDRAAKRRK